MSPELKLPETYTENAGIVVPVTVIALSTTMAGPLFGTELAVDVPFTASWVNAGTQMTAESVRISRVFISIGLKTYSLQNNCNHLPNQ